MKEREVSILINKPELTRMMVDPTLKLGDRFMPEPGTGEIQPASPAPPDKLGAVRAAWEKANQGRKGEVPVGERRTQEMLIERGIMPLAGASDTDPDQAPTSTTEYTAIRPDGKIEYYAKKGHLTEEEAKEFIRLFQGRELSASQQEMHDKLYEALQNDPAGFAKMFLKAIESIPEEDLKAIISNDSQELVGNFLDEVSRQTGGNLSPELMAKYRQEAEDLKSLPPHLARAELKKLLRKVERQRKKLTKNSTAGNPSENEPLTVDEIVGEIGLALDELPKALKAEYLNRASSALELSQEEQLEAFKDILSGIKEFSKSAKVIIAKQIEDFQRDEKADVNTTVRSRDRLPSETNGDSEGIIDEMLSDLNDLISQLGESDEKDQEIITLLTQKRELKGMVGALSGGDPSQLENVIEQINNIGASADDVDTKKTKLSEIIAAVGKNYKAYHSKRERDEYNPIHSIQDLAEKIAETQGEQMWGKDGHLPIIDRHERFHPENFLQWVRYNYNVNNDNNRSKPIDSFSQIYVKFGISQVSLYEMLFIDRGRYMTDKASGAILTPFADEVSNEVFVSTVVRNASLLHVQNMNYDTELPKLIGQLHANSDITQGTNLRDSLKMPALYGDERDRKLGLAVTFANNIYYNLPDYEKLIVILGGSEYKKALDALNAQNLPQDRYIEEHMKLQGKSTFSPEDFEDAIRILQDKMDWEDIDNYEGYYDKNNVFTQAQVGQNIEGYGIVTQADVGKNRGFYCMDLNPDTGERSGPYYFFDKEGNFNMQTFVKVMNVYKYPTPEQSLTKLLRELIRIKASDRYGVIRIDEDGKEIHDVSVGIARDQAGKDKKEAEWNAIVREQLNTGKTKEQAENEATRKLREVRLTQRINIQFGENMSYTFQRPYGRAAGNDVNVRGYDAQTKLAMYEYFKNQSKTKRAGPLGVYETIGIIRDANVDFWSGLKTESRNTPLEIFDHIIEIENDSFSALEQQLRAQNKTDDEINEAIEIERQKQIDEWLNKLRFNEGAEKEFAGNVLIRAFNVYHSQAGGDRVNLDKIVSWDQLYGPKLELSEFEETFKDKLIKDIRYLTSTNGAMKYSSKVRVLVGLENGVPIYKTVTQAQKEFSPEVLEEMEFKGQKIDFDNLTQEQANWLDYGGGRLELAKISVALTIAGHLRYHVGFGTLGKRWGYLRTEMLFTAMESLTEMEDDPANPGRLRKVIDEKTGKPKRFFDERLMKLMRSKGNSGAAKLFAMDVAGESMGPILMSILEILAKTVQYATK